MDGKKVYLASDNWAPAHPLILKAMAEANEGYAPSYGADSWTEKAQKLIQNAFNTSCKVFIAPSGTGANVFGLKLACGRHESIICTDIAHINYQESGAAEAVIGCKIVTVPHNNGKITPEAIYKKLKIERAFGKHSTSPRVLSISQPTEVGTVYTLDELTALADVCKEEKLYFHIDGSRIYNAMSYLDVSFETLVRKAKLDILSLGGTKNGLAGAEALIIFNPDLERGADHLHKQSLQLLSKMRYASCQFIPLFKNDLWRTLASDANRKAREFASIIEASPQLKLSYPVETNQIFFTAPASWIALMQEKIFCYKWDHEKNEVRFISSWCTTEQDVKDVREILSTIASESLVPS